MKEKALFALKVMIAFVAGFGLLAFFLYDRSQGDHVSRNGWSRDAIAFAGHRCGTIKSSKQEAKAVFVDCGVDGFYAIVETVYGTTRVLTREEIEEFAKQ